MNMPLFQAALDEIRQLIAADADLQARLQSAGDAAQAVGMIAAAAAATGRCFDSAELAAYAAEAASVAMLDDARLDAVAGGLSVKPKSLLS